MSPQHTIDCFADINTREACTVTQKLDLDHNVWKERGMRTVCHWSRDTNQFKVLKTHFLLQILGLFVSYDAVRMIFVIQNGV